MRSAVLIGCAVWILAVTGCRSSDEHGASTPPPGPTSPASASSKPADEPPPAPPKRILGLDEGWELAPKATYTASQTPSEVVIKATGEHPAAGYETKLVMSPLRIWPPQWMLAVKKPDGPAAQVITPFEVTASFKAGEPVRAVRVTDAAGRQDVPVDQARD